MNTDQCLINFKHRLLCLLPSAESLQVETVHQLSLSLTPRTREVFALATASFFRIPMSHGQWQTVMCLHYQGVALICQSQHWDALDEVCRTINQLAGITTIYIRGSDLCHLCLLKPDGQWVREAIS